MKEEIVKKVVKLELPVDVIEAIAQQAKRSGLSPHQVMVDLLRSALGLGTGLNDRKQADRTESQPLEIAELQQAMARVTVLELLLPKVAQLEQQMAGLLGGAGRVAIEQQQLESVAEEAAVQSVAVDEAIGTAIQPSQAQPSQAQPSQAQTPQAQTPQASQAVPKQALGSTVASLWLRTSQDEEPPASIPSTLLAGEAEPDCPRCQSKLPPPLQSSGRQVCRQCGWTDKPRIDQSRTEQSRTVSDSPILGQAQTVTSQPNLEKPTHLSAGELEHDVDLRKLLSQAAAASIDNMKPKKKKS